MSKIVLLDPELFYYLVMVGCSAGAIVYSPAFYIINLTVFIKENKLLLYVIVSTVEHGD